MSISLAVQWLLLGAGYLCLVKGAPQLAVVCIVGGLVVLALRPRKQR
jgi:hypothetical protein